jgi:hypothetical protein
MIRHMLIIMEVFLNSSIDIWIYLWEIDKCLDNSYPFVGFS